MANVSNQVVRQFMLFTMQGQNDRLKLNWFKNLIIYTICAIYLSMNDEFQSPAKNTASANEVLLANSSGTTGAPYVVKFSINLNG